jgi:filamentous hemagglutinin family protein
MASPSSRTLRSAALVAALAAAFPAWSNPVGGAVVAGSAAIAARPGLATITQQSQRAIIDWRSFSIGAGETTRFVQPSASAAILNRVTGGNPSSLFGTLHSNGQVFLVNPNGVLVGPGGQVLTAGFVASTHNVSNASFLQGGTLDFTGSSGASVVNLGTIRAESGDVHLIAQDVQNSGSIAAPKGVAGLASGASVLLVPDGSEHLVVQPQAAGTGGTLTQAGAIAAAQVELKAAGGNPYALAATPMRWRSTSAARSARCRRSRSGAR